MFCWKRRCLVTQEAEVWEVCKGISPVKHLCVFSSLWEVCFQSLQLVRSALGHEGGERREELIDISEWQLFVKKKKLLTGLSVDRHTLFWRWGLSKPNRTSHLNLIRGLCEPVCFCAYVCAWLGSKTSPWLCWAWWGNVIAYLCYRWPVPCSVPGMSGFGICVCSNRGQV